MHRQVRRSRLLVILTALVTAMTLVMPLGMARAANMKAPVTIANLSDLVFQPGNEPALMLDGNVNTRFHTKWADGYVPVFPYKIDLALAKTEQVKALEYTPTPGTSGGNLNGRVNGYKVYVGDDLGNMGTAVVDATFPNEPGKKTIALDAPGAFVRFEVLTTYGDTGQANKNVNVAEIAVLVFDESPAPTVTAAAQTLNRGANTVTFSLTNEGATEVTTTPVVTGPASFTIGTVAPVTIAAGATETFTVSVAVPAITNPGQFTLTATAEANSKTSTGTAAVTVALKAGQNRTELVTGLTAINNPPSQAAASSIDKAFDGNATTLYHSPWDGSYAPPNNIDIDLGAVVSLASLEYLPRPAGNVNGNWLGYEIWAGNDVTSLTEIAAGTMSNGSALKTVPLSGTAKIVRVRVLTSDGAGAEANKYITASEIRVFKAIADDAVPPLPVTLEGTLDSQPGAEAERMFDHDTLTHFHTPWNVDQTFPYNIDLNLGADPVDLSSFVMVPYVGGEPGSNNGRPGAYRILAGPSLADLTEYDAGTWVDTAAPKTVDLTAVPATAKFLRLEIGSTYGDITTVPADPQNDKYVAISELKVYGTAVPVVTEYLAVSMTRTDTLGVTVRPGDVLTFELVYENLTGSPVTAFPRESNLAGVLTGSAPNCRFVDIPANGTASCATATHTVNAADVTVGTFTPTVKFDATQEMAGTTVLQAGIVATLPAITVEAAGPVAVGVWVPSAYGQIRIESITPTKTEYLEGDVVTVLLRMESNASAPKRDVTGASTTLSNPSSCDWASFPAGVGGKYNCARTGKPALTYTVTPADVAAGVANFSLTYTETPVDGAGAPNGTPVTSTISGTLPVGTPSIEPRADGVYVALASAGDYGFVCHRIPALTVAPNGDILAAWDGRPEGCGDAPLANSIIQRRSTDGGQTWGPLTTIAAGSIPDPRHGYSDPSYVTDDVQGKVFAFFLKSYNRGWGNSLAGTDPLDREVLHAAVAESLDNGATWSAPRIITADITTDPVNWTSRFAASGEGIQLKYAPYAGRLIQQYTIKNNPAGGNGMQAVSVYSDDHGVTWEVGTPVGTGMDENKVVELSDGRVMLNSRASSGPAARKVAISTDGGITYGPVTSDMTLIDPRNNASIIRAYPDAPMNSAKAKVLLFSNAANTGGRSNGTVRVSFDDGQTWSGSRVFEPGAMSYSTLTPLTTEGKYGLFFEGAGNQMRYMTISMEWLGVLPLSISADAQTVNRGTNEVTFSATNLATTDVTFTPTFGLPGGWTASAVAPVTLAAGATGTFKTTVEVPNTADPGMVSMTATATVGGKNATGTAPLTVALKPGQNPTQAITVTPANTPPAQSGEGIDKAFDGDVTTLWHTPYGATVAVPVDVDMKLGEAPVAVASLEYVPRSDSSNGRINGYEIWAGDSLTDLTKVADGNFANSAATKVVPLNGTYQYLRLRAISSYGDTADKWVSAAEIRVRVAVPDTEVLPLPVTIVGTLPSQSGAGPENMIDGDPATHYHSPWNDTQDFPFNIDLSLGDDDVDLDSFVMTPHVGDGAGAANGRPGEYRILVGDSLDDLREVASGTWDNDETPKTVDLSSVVGTAKFVRLEIGSTYGDTGQTDKFVAINELQVFGTVVPPAQPFLELTLERTDTLGPFVNVGDVLTFKVSYTNTSDQVITAFPRSSNLDGVLLPETPNCRWVNLAAGDTRDCSTGTHTVTPADLSEGSFTPSVTFDATANQDGTDVLQAGVVATLPAINVRGVDPTLTPTVTVTAPTVTATSSATQTATSSATATTTAPTATATASTTATATATATATSTNTATATSTATATTTTTSTTTTTATATVTGAPTTAPAVTVTATTNPSVTPTVKPSVKPTVKPSVTPTGPVNVYTTPGYHTVNGRQWFTKCEPYSATTRCYTSIWASQIKNVNGKLQWVTGWAFNNLTYLPMSRATWGDNKLAYSNSWTSAEGRLWKTECDTPETGRNGCRSFIWTTVYEPTSPGANTFRQVNKWVFNNIVMFSA